ncbi:hypothetical protein [Pontibacter ruber]|uniref:Uncharacterized protein n=1 Tax=Pontibacter ruber TaxID=1343895 RepID=A0ABW5CXD5_9BACT|nr:hypothetical protein [Pontibacter ruber]
MRTFFTQTFAFVATVVLLSSCASSYKAVTPENITYSAKSESNNVVLQYKHGVLAERGNKKYVKKESRNFVQVVAVKLTNNSDQAINVSNDVKFFSGENQFTPLDPNVAHARLKQGVPIYLLYLGFTFTKITSTEMVNGQVTETGSFPIGVILGPGLTLFNMIRAGGANQQMLQNLERYNIANKQILPGETLHGLVVVPNSSYNPLNIKVGTEAVQARQ